MLYMLSKVVVCRLIWRKCCDVSNVMLCDKHFYSQVCLFVSVCVCVCVCVSDSVFVCVWVSADYLIVTFRRTPLA